MAAELILAPEAEQDISDAHDWYEQRRLLKLPQDDKCERRADQSVA